jgi:hypothetical protein
MTMALRLATILFSIFISTSVFASDLSPVSHLDIGKGGQCVEPDHALMRKTHMNLLKHQRDETMRKGIRGQKYSIADCVECHASVKTNSVLGSNEAFCQGCHVYAAVKLDCFECHSNKRKVTAEVGK